MYTNYAPLTVIASPAVMNTKQDIIMNDPAYNVLNMLITVSLASYRSLRMHHSVHRPNILYHILLQRLSFLYETNFKGNCSIVYTYILVS